MSDNPKSSAVVMASADGGTAVDVMELYEGEVFDLTDIQADYLETSGSSVTVELYDEEVGTGAGVLDDLVDHFRLQAGGDEYYESNLNRREVEHGIVALVSPAQDADILLTVGGTSKTV